MFHFIFRFYSSLRSSFFSCVFIIFFGLIITIPAWWSGNILGFDSMSHLVVSHQFIKQLFLGELYPRWLMLNSGMGNPVMFFYGPIPYYIAALFHPFFGGDPEGWHQLGMAASLAIITSGLVAFFWLNHIGGKLASFIGAIIYMGAPYHLKIDLYQRFAYAELWGFAWMPFVLWMVHLTIDKRRGALLGLAVSYALLVMTHLPSTLLFSLVPIIYSFVLSEKNERIFSFLKVSSGLLMGICMSAIYLFPSIFLQQAVQFGPMESGRLNFANNFLFFGPRFDLGAISILKEMGFVMGSTFLISFGMYILIRQYYPLLKVIRIANFWVCVAIVSFFMMLPFSKGVWEWLPIVQRVQFPARFGVVLTLSMAALLTQCLSCAGELFLRKNISLLFITSLVWLSQVIPIFVSEYATFVIWSRKPSLSWWHSQMVEMGDTARGVVEAAQIGGYTFFLPSGIDQSIFWVSYGNRNRIALLKSLAATPDVSVISPVSGKQNVQLIHISSRNIRLTVQSGVPLLLRVRQFYFSGWSATSNEAKGNLVLRMSKGDGFIELEVPAGVKNISLDLNDGVAERCGKIVSLASLFVFFVSFLFVFFGRNKSTGFNQIRGHIVSR